MTDPDVVQLRTAELWEDLKHLISSVVEEMNRLDELSQRTGGLDYQLVDSEQIEIHNQSLPRMTVNLHLRREALNIEATLVINQTSGEEHEVRDLLEIHVEDDGVVLRDSSGNLLSAGETVFQLLRPFLHLSAV